MTPEEKTCYYAWRKATETDRRQCEVLEIIADNQEAGGVGLRISRGIPTWRQSGWLMRHRGDGQRFVVARIRYRDVIDRTASKPDNLLRPTNHRARSY